MKISRKEVDHVSRLARLSLTEDEAGKMTDQLDKILEYVEKLSELDTKDVQPTSHVIPMSNVWREDAARPSLPREEALANAPDTDGEFFRVPKIIE
ncbi:MAG: asparaginyl/glutamyl-tRNA amidotransferase subunit C [Nitrospirae bacterium RBG_16_64_22]|nr:MAG: asparaginyl/glutamyl-tRNA amidotransferase subunit C [Nitrospirae bacterium RBG_16_64_22]